MQLDASCLARPRLAAARQLQRAGRWDLALDLLAAEPPDPSATALRAEILVDRHWWRLDRAEARTERDLLRDTATRLADELGIPWLLAELRGDPT